MLGGSFRVGAAAADFVQRPNYKRDVAAWADDRLGAFMWSKQREIAATLLEEQRVLVPSCHDSGKSWLSAALASWWIDTHPPREARVITTAPSAAQVKGVLWNEINTMFDVAREREKPLPGRVNQTEWWIGGYMAGIGRKPNDYKPEQFAGFHARYPLIILDEADGLPLEMWDGVEALMTSTGAKLIAIGNPLDPGSRFAEEQRDGVYPVIRIAAWDTPNFTGERVPPLLNEVLLDPGWVDGRRRKWGEDHPFWHGRVLAQYPDQDVASIIKAGDLEKCRLGMEDDAGRLKDPPKNAWRQMGVDVAGSENGDRTVCTERVGNFALREWDLQSADDDEIEEFIVDCAHKCQPNAIAMDATGLGFGFVGRVRRRVPRAQMLPVNFGAKAAIKNADGSKKFENMRAQLWWEIGREMSRKGPRDGWNLSHMENAEDTMVELAAARYLPDVLSKKKVVQVEDKGAIRSRIRRSPDSADSRLLSFLRPADAMAAEEMEPAVVTRPKRTVGTRPSTDLAAAARAGAGRGTLGVARGRGVRGVTRWQ